MKHEPKSARVNASIDSRGRTSQGGLALLENEIAELKEKNASLQRRLEEVEMSAEFRVRADRILAIPLSRDP